MMAEYKCILVKNNTAESRVTLFIYSRYDPVCWLSTSSKILTPGVSHLHRSADGFKFQIKSSFEKNQKTVVGVRKWTKDTYIAIYNNGDVKESNLTDHEFETRVCIRKLNFEASTDKGRDLYRILELNCEDVRKLEKGKQDEVIKKAFHQQIRRWHTDTAGELGDEEMAHEVIVAYDILRDPERKAKYHNSYDYSKGWFSKARWSSIFFTECATKEQKNRYKRRLAMMAMSLGIGIGGSLLVFLTAGAASPAVAAVCGTLGEGCYRGGVQSIFRTMTRESIVEGCDFKNYAISFGFGFVAGVVKGSECIGKTGTTGIAAIQAASMTSSQLISLTLANAIPGTTAMSLAADVEKKIVDGEDLTRKKVLWNVTMAKLRSAAFIAVKEIYRILQI